MDTTRRPISLR